MAPISVDEPVAKTTPFARPLVTVEPLYATLSRSPGPVSSANKVPPSSAFRTGRLSPVSSASSVSKFLVSMSLMSAGIVSPVLTSTRSPGTISPDGTTVASPPLTTVAVGEPRDLRESIVFSAEYSWKKPTTTLSKMTAATTPPSM